MKTIRNNVFETNSSSIHSVTLLNDYEYNILKDNKGFLMNDEYPNKKLIECEKDVFDIFSESYKDEEDKQENWIQSIFSLSEGERKEVFDFVLSNLDGLDGIEELDSFNEGQIEYLDYIKCEEPFNLKNLGWNEYETFDEEKIIDGVKVHAIGYYGHD